jgi:hypothetical protein
MKRWKAEVIISSLLKLNLGSVVRMVPAGDAARPMTFRLRSGRGPVSLVLSGVGESACAAREVHQVRSKRCWIVPVTLALLVLPGFAQQLEEYAQGYREDQEALRGYTWKSRVRFSLDGKLKSTQVFEESYDERGRLQRRLLDSEPKAKPNKNLTKVDQARHDVRNLMDGYTHMSAENFRKVFGRPLVTEGTGEMQGLARLHARDVIHMGDSMYVWVDEGRKRLRRFEIKTTLQKEPVRVVADFEDLQGGPTHIARSTVATRHKKKEMLIETEYFDFVRKGS